MYKLFLTLRYLTRRPLSLVAIAALSLSVWTLVVAPSVMNGFQVEFHKRVRGTLSDVTISSDRPFSLPEDPPTVQALEAVPGVKAVAPYLENPALDKHRRKMDYCFLRGVDPAREAQIGSFESYFMSPREVYLSLNDYERQSGDVKAQLEAQAAEAGYTDVKDPQGVFRALVEGDPAAPGVPTCAVGIFYLIAWDLRLGDTIRLTTATDAGEVNQDKEFRIVGVFRTGFSENDRRQVVMSVRSLQDFIGVPGKLSGYSIKTVDYEQAAVTRQAIVDAWKAGTITLTPRIQVLTWLERNQNLLKAVAMERLLITIITFIIVVAATASIFLVLFMTVHSKTREFGILRAIGGTPGGVLSLFMGQGFLLAFLGMALGLALGVLSSWYVNEAADLIHRLTGWHPFPPDVYYLERIPTKIDVAQNVFNFVAVLAMGSVAAIVPGMLAALRPPLKAIRHD